ncbi:hypothetical protein [Demequina sp.]|uniref:hypothetical protein n=1 Tax=Demequina sp. TaxID=2050685 RepID=UPI0025DBDFEE|nr:hypothetical protein [Demequina sp.]
MSAGLYRDVDPTLPWMGASSLGPRRLTREAAVAVMACADPLALALMLAYARSYAAALGGVVQGSAAAVALGLLGHRREAAFAAAGAGLSALVVVEARRRARQWESVIGARLASLPADGA